MSESSTIEWTDATWNPVTGCTKISPGCKFCYAERMAKRLHGMGSWNYRDGFRLTLQPQLLERPLSWKSPRRIFVNSMSDLFHESIPVDYLKQVFDVMRRASWHTFQILTKRAEYLARMNHEIDWPSNVWMGVSLENSDFLHRIDLLRQTSASIRFLSIEPLLGPLPRLNLDGIDWVIVGGESGPKARPVEERWVVRIQKDCSRARVPFFFKQWGGRNKKASGRQLRGRTWDEFPYRIPTELVTKSA